MTPGNEGGHSRVLTKCPFDGAASESRPEMGRIIRAVCTQRETFRLNGDERSVVLTKRPFGGVASASRPRVDRIIPQVAMQFETPFEKATGTASC
jgi:hypothetical protein